MRREREREADKRTENRQIGRLISLIDKQKQKGKEREKRPLMEKKNMMN